MSRLSLTPENIEFIRNNYLTMTGTDMAEKIGVLKGVVNRFQILNGMSTPKQVAIACRVEKQKLHTTATAEQDAFIKENYLTIPIKAMERLMGKSSTFIITRMKKLGLVIPEEIIIQRKLASQIQSGSTPPNKGKKMDPEMYERVKHTFFTKGHKPKNTLTDNAITIRHNHIERGSRPYKMIRISEGVWEFLHRFNWIKANGPVPQGMIVVFKNGDTMNCDLDNLECITFEENMIRNSMHFKDYPKEIKDAAYSVVLLNKTIKQLEHGKKQNKFK